MGIDSLTVGFPIFRPVMLVFKEVDNQSKSSFPSTNACWFSQTPWLCLTSFWLQRLGTGSILGNPSWHRFFWSFFRWEMIGNLSLLIFFLKKDILKQESMVFCSGFGGSFSSRVLAGSVEKWWHRALQLLWNLQLLGLRPERTSYNMVCSSCERDEQPGQLGVRQDFLAKQRNM